MTAAPRRLDPALVAYAALAAVAAAQTVAGRASIGDVGTFAAPALLIWALLRWRPAADVVVRALALAGAALSLWALVAFTLALPDAAGPAGFYVVKNAVRTPVAPHNILASLLLVALVAAVVRAGAPRREHGAVAAHTPAALVVLGLAATLSRGAVLVGVGGALAALMVARWRPALVPRQVALRLVAASALATALVLGAAGVLGAAVPEQGEPTSVVSRTQLWRAGAEAIREQPVVGVGLDGFAEVARREGAADPRPHAHDLVLHAAATVGIPAALVYLAIWLLLALRAIGPRGAEAPRPGVVVALLGGALLFAHGLVDETAFHPAVELVVATLVTLPLLGGREAGSGPERL